MNRQEINSEERQHQHIVDPELAAGPKQEVNRAQQEKVVTAPKV